MEKVNIAFDREEKVLFIYSDYNRFSDEIYDLINNRQFALYTPVEATFDYSTLKIEHKGGVDNNIVTRDLQAAAFQIMDSYKGKADIRVVDKDNLYMFDDEDGV